jgi:hypothetical protein
MSLLSAQSSGQIVPTPSLSRYGPKAFLRGHLAYLDAIVEAQMPVHLIGW